VAASTVTVDRRHGRRAWEQTESRDTWRNQDTAGIDHQHHHLQRTTTQQSYQHDMTDTHHQCSNDARHLLAQQQQQLCLTILTERRLGKDLTKAYK